MTILQRSTFVGTEHADVRPGAYSKTSVVEGIVKDQAYLYERITNLTVPDAASAAVVGHDHSGAGDGAIIRVPICQQYMGALLQKRPTLASAIDGGVNYTGWSKLIWHPFYSEPGVDTMTCILWVDRETYAYSETFRAYMMDATSFAVIGNVQVANGVRNYLIGDNDQIGMVYDLQVTPGGFLHLLVVEAWDGYYHPTVPVNTTNVGELMPDFRRVMGFTLMPQIRTPNRRLRQYSTSSVTTASTITPSAYVSMDGALVQDDVGVSSYHLISMAKDDAMLQELATDKPAGNAAATIVDGHNHEGGATLATCGAPLQRTIGSWFYGTVRAAVGIDSSNYNSTYTDVIGGLTNYWTGGVNAITINSSAGTTARTVATHLFRMPELTAAQLAASTGAINAVVFVNVDTSKANLTVTVSIGDQSGASFGTASSHTFTAAGRQVYSFNAIDASALSAGGVIGTLKVTMQNSSNSNGSSFLYGVSLWYEP